jgi:hypothetical protein
MNQTTYLFANPSFLEGMARVLDIGANLEILVAGSIFQD